jgi:hypothetical protein
MVDGNSMRPMNRTPATSRLGFATARRSISALAIVALVATVAHAQETRNAVRNLDRETRGELSLQLLAEIKTKDNVLLKWCGDKVVFPDHRIVFGVSASAGASARVEKLVEIQDAIHGRSFDCSRDGKTILFLNGSEDRLFIFESSQLSEYTISAPGVGGLGFRYGSLLSPDGKTIAMPATVVRLNQGPDVLKSKRILKTPNADVFWTRHNVIYERRYNRFSVVSLPDLKTERIVALPRDILVNGIHECGGRHVLYYIGDHDNLHLVSLNLQTFALGASLMPSAEVGGINSNGDECVLIKSNHAGATQLIFLRGKNKQSIDIGHLRFSENFVLSKDGQALATFQSDRVGVDGGRVLIFGVVAADPR